MAAGQTSDATKTSPILKLEGIKAVSMIDERFSKWAFYRLESTLGPKSSNVTQQVVTTGSGNAQQEKATIESARALQRVAETVQKMAEQQAQAIAKSGAAATKTDTKVFTLYSLAALCGWAGVFEENKAPPIWSLLLQSTNMDDHRLNITRAMQEMAKAKEMEFEMGVYFTDKFLKAIVGMSPNPGEGIATFDSLSKGLSIRMCQPNTAIEIEAIKAREKAEKATSANLSYKEALQMETSDMRSPATNYRDLRLNVSLFGLFCYVIYGEQCDFAKQVHYIY